MQGRGLGLGLALAFTWSHAAWGQPSEPPSEPPAASASPAPPPPSASGETEHEAAAGRGAAASPPPSTEPPDEPPDHPRAEGPSPPGAGVLRAAPEDEPDATLADSEIEVDPETQSLDVAAGGLRYLLDAIQVRGNRKTQASAILAFVELEKGESFAVDASPLEALRYRLLATGWFERVELRLERGHGPGWVVLVIEVVERQTLVFEQLAAGVGWTVSSATDAGRKPEPYLGLSLAETNLLGTGRTLGGQTLLSLDQQGIALRFLEPQLRASRWAIGAEALFTKGREYFGGDHDVLASVDCKPDGRSESCESDPEAAVVEYRRAGLSLSASRDVGPFVRLSAGWHGDYVSVPSDAMPVAASEVRGRGYSPWRRTPIDFSIEPNTSYVSMLTLGLSYDRRDGNPLPSHGTLVWFRGDLASGLVGSDYEFVRLQSSANHWFSIGSGHVLRVGGFAGSVFGYAPFFYKFFVSDLTDLQPSRILGLNLDHRPAPNLFGLLECGRAFDPRCGTAIAQMRQEQLAARVDVEYAWPFLRGRRGFLKGGDLFGLIGIFSLLDPDDLRLAVPGYEGISRVPVDLTLDVGVRLDTDMGVFRLGLAKLAWLPVR